MAAAIPRHKAACRLARNQRALGSIRQKTTAQGRMYTIAYLASRPRPIAMPAAAAAFASRLSIAHRRNSSAADQKKRSGTSVEIRREESETAGRVA